ncbi:MAG TPA: isochorismatase family protein [Bryobacteraceae bacterium]|jgi:nicotinamidase/pyrazinamidase|nr:isochorismatase family protein [Bryobacteraceae bacterium]
MRAFFDIDTQLDFLYPAGALYTPGAESVIPAVAALNQYAGRHGIPLISTVCSHEEAAEEFKVWPPHCVAGTWGQRKPAATVFSGQIVPAQIVIEKNELDLFSNPRTEALLDSYPGAECVVYGVLTEYCVRLAIMGMLRRGRKVSLVTDAIYHLSESAAAATMSEFLAAGGVCVEKNSILGH